MNNESQVSILRSMALESGREIRVGTGVDAHRLVSGRPLVLGGVSIPFEEGLDGHSDGDVLTHAVIDALLGAAGLGDIGARFGRSDPEWKDASSLSMLTIVAQMLAEAGWRVVNIDAVVIAERPALAPHRSQICKALAEALGIDPVRVSVKGTTTDGMGLTGRGEGIAASAATLLESV